MSVMEAAVKTHFANLTFDEKLNRLAVVAVKVGLGSSRWTGVDHVGSDGGAATCTQDHGARL